MKAPITFAIAGFRRPGGSTYASMQKLFPDRMKVVAVADINPEKVQKAKEACRIKDELCFTSAEEMLAQDKLADVMVVSTMDRQHVNHAIPALEKGYNILMESRSPGSSGVQAYHRGCKALPRQDHRASCSALYHVL